ncbi:MAG TPA: HAMP domain-containing sensor histidine kinase [Gemmatimonadales bacterium]|jgi:signal transduction histidine kinase|nr:HAMP domain-containing sensor histidine kinase [Gemmatimonadales bacterium]
MRFRTRLLISFGVVVLIPLLVFGLGIRREMTKRVTSEYDRRVNALVGVINADIAREDDRIRARLAALKSSLADDSRFRGVVVRGEDRSYALDYAGNAMRVAGLDFLQIQDDEGRIVSSGHFRNEFDRLGPAVPGMGPALVRAAAAEGPFLALVSSDTLSIGARRFRLIGGIAVDSQFLARLARDPELGVGLALPHDTTNADSGKLVVGERSLPYVDAADGPGRVEQARIVVTRSSALLTALQRNVNLWFAAAVLIAALAALLLAGWLSTRISEPVEAGIREMERRIAIGDLARQVNHDVKNGLAPLRNVFRHLTQVARDKPAELPQVFAERQGTVESSINYLETLAANYAKLSPQTERKATDVNAVVRETIGGSGAVKTKLAEGLPPVSADALVLRRVIENLVSNAVDSLDGKNGTVTVTTEQGKGIVRIAVSDTGRGMSKAELDRAFDDFYTTKAGGTGLGLSIVRRLVLDSNGSLQVETEPGEGSKFIVEIPVQ